MTTPGQATVPPWKVTQILSGQMKPDATGEPVEGHTVFFQFDNGVTGQAFVPDSIWDTPAAEAKVQAAAARAASILTLTGGGA